MTVRRVGIAAAAVAFVGLLLLAWRSWGPDDPPADTARLDVNGVAEITGVDGEVTTESGIRRVAYGETVTMVAGDATLSTDDATFGLRSGVDAGTDSGTDAGTDSVVVVDDVPRLVAGELLVETDDRGSVTGDAGSVDVTRGAAAVAVADGGVDVRAYAGRAEVVVGDRTVSVPALRSAEIGADSSGPGPIAYDPDDAWDRRFLGDAIAFGDELERKALGLVRNLPAGTEVDAAFLERVLPALAASSEFRADFIEPGREPAETLIGASIVSLGRRGDVADRWDAVFAFRDEGAHWGLVALDQGVNEQPALELIDLAIGSEELAFRNPEPSDPSPPAPTTPVDPGDPDPPTPPTPPPTTPPTPPPTDPSPPPPGPLDLPLDPVDDLVDDLLDDLLGGLLDGSGDTPLLGGG